MAIRNGGGIVCALRYKDGFGSEIFAEWVPLREVMTEAILSNGSNRVSAFAPNCLQQLTIPGPAPIMTKLVPHRRYKT